MSGESSHCLAMTASELCLQKSTAISYMSTSREFDSSLLRAMPLRLAGTFLPSVRPSVTARSEPGPSATSFALSISHYLTRTTGLSYCHCRVFTDLIVMSLFLTLSTNTRALALYMTAIYDDARLRIVFVLRIFKI